MKRWHRLPSKNVAVLSVLLALVVLACTDQGSAPRQGDLPTGDALTSLIAEKGIHHEYTMSARTDVVSVNDVDTLEVLEDIVVEEMRPLRMAEGVELLDARVSFLHWRGKAFQGPDGVPSSNLGAFCTDTWPPKGFSTWIAGRDRSNSLNERCGFRGFR